MRPGRRRTDFVVWHCSATPPSRDIGSADIDLMHKARNWAGIGYHIVIKRSGAIQLGENLSHWGAHAAGYNAKSIGICLVGGVDEDGNAENNFTEAQWVAAKNVFEFVVLLYPTADHVGHRDLSPDRDGDARIDRWEFMKDCPCYSVQQWIENDLEAVSDLYAPWEEDTSIEVPTGEITFEEVLDDDYDDDDDGLRE